jgi:hypothetical protein
VLRAIAAVAVISAFLFAPAAVGSEVPQLEITEPSSPATVEFDTSRIATISVSIHNPSVRDVDVTASFVDVAAGGITEASPSQAPVTAGRVALVEPTAPIQVGSGAALKVVVRLSAAADVDLDGIAGTIVFQTNTHAVLGATLDISTAEPDPFAGARVEPATLTINANRGWPSFIPFDCDCWAYWILVPDDAARYPIFIHGPEEASGLPTVGTYLSSDTGGRLRVSLKDFGLDGHGNTIDTLPVPGIVRLGEVDRAGKFSGKLSLNPDDPKTAVLDVTVNVQDFFLWPLLAVLLGEGIAFGLAYWRDRVRAKDLPEGALGAAKWAFDKAIAELTPVELSWFDGLFLPPTSHPRWEPRAHKILRAIRTAPDKGVLEDAAKEVEDVVAIWESLGNLRKASSQLQRLVDENLVIDPEAAVFTHARALLEPRQSGFAKAADAKDLATKLADQIDAIEILRRAYTERNLGVALWLQLSDSAMAELFAENPTAYWLQVVRRLETKAELTDDDVISELMGRNTAILAYVLAHPEALAETIVEDAGVIEFQQSVRAWRGDRLLIDSMDYHRIVAGLPTPVLPDSRFVPIEWRDPVALSLRIRAYDSADFAVSLVLGIVTTFVALYVDKNFGTGWQYLLAIATGFAATALVLQLLPWYRQYRVGSAPEPAKS